MVSEADLPLFNTLRDWRLERSKQKGVPPYVICTNRQLAATVQARPQSLVNLSGMNIASTPIFDPICCIARGVWGMPELNAQDNY
jgi:hypothetical protein